jgi:6-phosphogluconolactonase
MKPELFSYPDATALSAAVARRWLALVASATAAGERHRVALAGGRIAKDFMTAAAALAKDQAQSLAGVDFFWGDERCVPPEHPDSNFLLASQAMLQPLGIASERIHRIRGEADPALAAREAAAELRTHCPAGPHGQPILDLVLLGMGEDGHIASLFPGAPSEVVNSSATYLPVVGPKPPPQRITLSFPAIGAARLVWVLVFGAGKENALRESLASATATPLGRVLAGRSATIFSAR